MRLTNRLRRALRPNIVYVGVVMPDVTVEQLRASCPGLTDRERLSLIAGRTGITRYFRTPDAAIRFYANIHGDDHPSWGFSRGPQGPTRWDHGSKRGWSPVYACLTLDGTLVTENS